MQHYSIGAVAKLNTVGDGLYNIGAELLKEMGEVAVGASSQSPQQSPGLHLLRGMLQELNNPSLGGGIILFPLDDTLQFHIGSMRGMMEEVEG